MIYEFSVEIKSNSDIMADNCGGMQSAIELNNIVEQVRCAQLELEELQKLMAFKIALCENMLHSRRLDV